ncbi:hypothetical protein HOL59_02985 [Candidatus Woesearchaeota archaeon]|jgi:hypothetical protein|nr:hypothetical protein [Candidatus Woesearchaeota archaeon]
MIDEKLEEMGMINKTEKQICLAKCRDDTNCLNVAHEGMYCWLHAKKNKEI